MLRPSTTANNVSVDVLSSFELSTTPFQLRIEKLYIGESADIIQRSLKLMSHGSSADRLPTFPMILGIRSVAHLMIENQFVCPPIISGLGHLEIIPNKSSSNVLSHESSSSQMSPDYFIVNFSSVMTFSLNVSDLPLDSRIDLSFICVDLGVEIGKISFQVFAHTGVLRQGRFLLPFGLKHFSNQLKDNSDQWTRLNSHDSKGLHGVCAHCAASSRYVSRFGSLEETSDSDSDSLDESVKSDLDSDSEFDQTTYDDHNETIKTLNNDATAQSILSLFLGNRSSNRGQSLHRNLSRDPHDQNNIKRSITRDSFTLNGKASRSSSEPESFQTCPRLETDSNCSSTDQILFKSEVGENDDFPLSNLLCRETTSPAHQSGVHQDVVSPTGSSSSSIDDDFSCIFISSGTLSSWSSSSSLNVENVQSSTEMIEKEQNYDSVIEDQNICISSSLNSSSRSSYAFIPENSNLTEKSVGQLNDDLGIRKDNNVDGDPTQTDRNNKHRKSKKLTQHRRQRVMSFRRVSKCVYRAMNCYKLLDLFSRGVITKCPFTNDVCQLQIQLQCERNVSKSLIYFGFVAVCLPVFPTPVIYSTTPPLRHLCDFREENSTERNKKQAKTTVWSSGSYVMGSTSIPSWENIGTGPTSAMGSSGFRPHRRSVYTPPTVLLDRHLNDSHIWTELHVDDDQPSGDELEENYSKQRLNIFDRQPLNGWTRRHTLCDRYVENEDNARKLETLDECANWFQKTLEISSWRSRNSLLSVAHNIVVHNSVNQQRRQQHEHSLVAIQINDSKKNLDGLLQPATTDNLGTTNHRSFSVPSFEVYRNKTTDMTTIDQSIKQSPSYPPTNISHITHPYESSNILNKHQMKLLQDYWNLSQSNFYLRDLHCPIERLYLKQQRQLVISAMDRHRALDESAIKEGRSIVGFSDLSSSLKPAQISEYQLLDATLSLPSLAPADKRLLWRHRQTLKDQGVSVLKLAAAVDWTTSQQPKEFNELLQTWKLPSIEGTLELLSNLSSIPCVRQFGCRALEAATDYEICRYLPQLVQGIRFDMPGPNAPVLSALLRRASVCPRIASSLHWGLQCESEDSEKGHLFIRGHQRLLETLGKTPEGSIGRRILKILELQGRFAVALRNLASKIRDRRDRADRKTERLRELLTLSQLESLDLLHLTNCQQPIPLPIAPYGLLLGIVPEKSHVFKSSQYPLVLTCRVLVPQSYHGTGEDGQSDESVEFDSIDCNNEEIRELWEQEIVDIDQLKAKGCKEILKRYLFKTGDDLRQDQLVTQIIQILKDLLAGYGCDYRLTVYDVIAFSRNDGLVEFIEKAEPISSIKKSYPTIRHYFAAYSSNSNCPLGFPKSVLDTFIRSCSGYSVVTFILGVGDRHLDNLLLREDGRLFHVDFGFILGDDPKPFPPPMKLCSEMIEGLGGIGSECYTTFQLMCCQFFRCIRRHSKLILDVLLMMSNSGIRALKTDALSTIGRVQEKFQLDLPEVEAEAFLLDIIGVSATALFPAVVDKFHEWSLYWK